MTSWPLVHSQQPLPNELFIVEVASSDFRINHINRLSNRVERGVSDRTRWEIADHHKEE